MLTIKAVLALVVLGRGGEGAIIITAGPEPSGHEQVQDMIRNSTERTWCQPGNIRQILTHPHCENQELENSVCMGSCLSFSLPRTLPPSRGDELLDLCETCQADQVQWLNVSLSCSLDGHPFSEVKVVQKITSCKCAKCPPARPAPHPSPPRGSGGHESLITNDIPPGLYPPTPGHSPDPHQAPPLTDPTRLQLLREAGPNILTHDNPEGLLQQLNLVGLNGKPIPYEALQPLQYETPHANPSPPAISDSNIGLADLVRNLDSIQYRTMSINQLRSELQKKAAAN